MKKIIFYLSTFVYLLFAFKEMPPGWRHKLNLSFPVQGDKIWSDSKGDTIIVVFYNGLKSYLRYSEDDGFSWSDTLLVKYSNNTPVTNVGDLSIAIDKASNIYLAIYRFNDYALVCLVSHNMGRTWNEIFIVQNDGLTGDRHPWITSFGYNEAYLAYRVKDSYNHSVVKITHIFNNGNNYTEEIIPHDESSYQIQNYPRITIGKDTTIYVVYNNPTADPGGPYQGMLARKKGGTWEFSYFPDKYTAMAWLKPNKIIIPDNNNPNTLYALVYISSSNSFPTGLHYMKSENRGISWTSIKNLADIGNTYPESDFTIDEEKILLLTKYNTGGVHLFESYNGGNTWTEYPDAIFNSVMFRLTNNRRSRVITFNDHANNEILTFISDDRQLLSPFSTATAYNNAKHLARKPNSDDLYLVYTMNTDSSDVCFTYSLDGGNVWKPYEIIGHGVYPSIEIRQSTSLLKRDSPDFSNTYDVYVVFAKSPDKLLFRTKRIGEFPVDWSRIIVLNMPSGFTPFQGDGVLYYPHYITSITISNDMFQNRFLHVVLRARESNSGELKLLHLVYNITSIDYQNTAQLDPVGYYTINTVPSYPSITCSGGKLHLVWQYNDKIYYSESWADPININWTSPLPISHPGVTAINPSIEAYGDSVYVTWSEDYYGTGKHEVYKRSHYKFHDYFEWSGIQQISQTPSYDSRYPTDAEGEFEVWVEETPTDYDPYYNRRGSYPGVLKNTDNDSYFPHSNRYKTQLATYLYSIFTERDHLVYRIISGKKTFPEPQPTLTGNSFRSYSASDNNSPYLVYRGGRKSYGNIITDVGQTLIYRFPLDTSYIYKMRVRFYFQGNETRRAKIVLPNALPFEFSYKPNLDEEIIFPIHPLSIMNDTLFITFKNSQGAELSLKSIEIYRYEREESEQGPQMFKYTVNKNRGKVFSARYDPKKENITVEFSLNKLSSVDMSIFDVSGRKIESLMEDNLLPRGSYVFKFKKPKNIRTGIYFIRLRMEDKNEVEKIIIN